MMPALNVTETEPVSVSTFKAATFFLNRSSMLEMNSMATLGNNEFFSANTAAEIRIANALLNFSGKFFKSEIADSMSVRIVDSFEMVKVEKKKSACMPSVRSEIDCVEKFFFKGVPVIIICQRVMRRNLFKCLGGLVKFMYGRTDVFDNGLKRA